MSVRVGVSAAKRWTLYRRRSIITVILGKTSFAAMTRPLIPLALWLAVAGGLFQAVFSRASVAGPLETSGDVRWIVFASRQDPDEAIGVARGFGSEFGAPSVMSTTNGWYAVAAGPVSVRDVAAFKKRLSDAWWPPKDAFFSKGQTFIEKVWEAPRSPVLASASSSEGQPRVAVAEGVEATIDGNVVHVRIGGRDVAAVSFDDDASRDASASIVRLDPSTPYPQIVATHFTGGAHCCTFMKVVTFVDGRWKTVNIGEFDSEGPLIEDLNGDGAAELVGKDDSFDYAFASYAESHAPPKIQRLIGDRIVNVTTQPEFRKPLVQFLLADQGRATSERWRDNGFLAGWVAHNALIGNGVEAWQKMLNLYDRNSEWDLSVCTVATKNFDPCPEDAKRYRDFPTALREHLAKNGYVLEGAAAPPPPVPAVARAEEATPSPKPSHQGSSGTGFFVTADGAAVTNAHVVEDCHVIRVTSDQGDTATARVAARDGRNDLALLTTGLSARKPAAFRTSIRLGEPVEAFGYPLTQVLAKSGNFTLGNVSALVGLSDDSRYLQISAPVQPGNSGGPLLDQNGNLVGVVSAKLNALRTMVATNGDIPQNVNFAIRASIVASFLEANGIAYASGAAVQPMQPADLADQAKAVSVFIECE